ncbi:acyl carrier protein [Faecalimonas sp.]
MGNLENIICKYVTDTSIELSDNTNLMRDLELSSLDFADILCDIEDYYGIEVNEKDINNIMTIGEIKSYIEGKV